MPTNRWRIVYWVEGEIKEDVFSGERSWVHDLHSDATIVRLPTLTITAWKGGIVISIRET